jgi:hypothetical protein
MDWVAWQRFPPSSDLKIFHEEGLGKDQVRFSPDKFAGDAREEKRESLGWA